MPQGVIHLGVYSMAWERMRVSGVECSADDDWIQLVDGDAFSWKLAVFWSSSVSY